MSNFFIRRPIVAIVIAVVTVLVGADDKVQLRRVEVGPGTGQVRIVSSGLQAGERVVVDGVQKVSDGAVVRPQPAPELSAAPAAASR